ncbi:hypothetical protein LCGC14_1211870 [marine sediment metagenome]|uniref:Uncharacterized protein n=1 Tax=marine sediment metagenome TaxID=412755 RepID=A0A0F9M164_9ZZZZ
MNINGLPFLQFKSQLIYEFGEERLNDFFEALKDTNSFFEDAVLATTKIPLEDFLAFMDAMVKEFYNDDEKIFWKFGKQAAIVSLRESGPYYAFMRSKRTPESFFSSILHRVWTMTYDEGIAKNVVEGNFFHVYILNLPLYHVYLEYSTMGFVKKALELYGTTIKEIIKVKASAKEIYYKLILDL